MRLPPVCLMSLEPGGRHFDVIWMSLPPAPYLIGAQAETNMLRSMMEEASSECKARQRDVSLSISCVLPMRLPAKRRSAHGMETPGVRYRCRRRR